jgi:acetolactate synthase regulatory subunit
MQIIADELAARTPATLSELIEAVRQRGFRLNELEMAAALGALIEQGRAEIQPPVRQMRRYAHAPAMYAALLTRRAAAEPAP